MLVEKKVTDDKRKEHEEFLRLAREEAATPTNEDFKNDKVDAGDIGAGHSVTALYELTLLDSKEKFNDELRYQTSNTKDHDALVNCIHDPHQELTLISSFHPLKEIILAENQLKFHFFFEKTLRKVLLGKTTSRNADTKTVPNTFNKIKPHNLRSSDNISGHSLIIIKLENIV